MAVADKVGFDRCGNKLYKRTPDGEEIIEPRQHTERIRIGGRGLEGRPEGGGRPKRPSGTSGKGRPSGTR